MQATKETEYDTHSALQLAHLIDASKGWNEEEKTQGDWAILVMTEISEAFEEYRKNREPGEIYYSSDGKPEGMAIEYADALIRILHWFEYHDLDPRYFMIKKLRYNITRPHRHGGKRV